MLDGQGFELPFGLDMSDFRALDFRQRLIDGDQGLVKPRSDRLNVAEREFDRVELRPQIFIAQADRRENVRGLLRLRRRLSSPSRLLAPDGSRIASSKLKPSGYLPTSLDDLRRTTRTQENLLTVTH